MLYIKAADVAMTAAKDSELTISLDHFTRYDMRYIVCVPLTSVGVCFHWGTSRELWRDHFGLQEPNSLEVKFCKSFKVGDRRSLLKDRRQIHFSLKNQWP